MEYIKLQFGCLAVLIYVTVVYIQGCFKYHVKIRSSHFWKLLLLGLFTAIVDGDNAWVSGHAQELSPVLSYVFHALSFVGLDATIFFLAIYMLSMTGSYPKKHGYLLYMLLGINIAAIGTLVGLPVYLAGGQLVDYSSGPAAAMYVCFGMIAVYIVMTALMCRKNFNLIKRERRRGIITVLFSYAIISTLQIIFAKQLGSMSVGVTILILGMYLTCEDPAIKQLGRYYTETVMSFANLIEERDGSTGGHIKRTSRYVELIVDKLREQDKYKKILTRDYIDNLLNAAPMHDIGKIAIPDAILQKPGKLTDEEFAVMKTHAEHGGKIIVETFGKFLKKDYCDMAYEVARYHHEKWNGRGYPEGLKEQEIPLAARIMAVADVFDAVSEKRCYRDAMPLEKCFEIIEQGRGKDFDPDVVDAFMSLKERVTETHAMLGAGADNSAQKDDTPQDMQ